MARITLESIVHRYDGEAVLEDFSLAIQSNDFVSIIGPSGSGKTTILRLIAGLEDVQAGCVKVDDTIVASADMSLPTRERGVGMVFQHPSLFPHLNVAENISFGLREQSREAQRKAVAHWLCMLDMEGAEARYPHMLSGGEQQRVALARTLATSPHILLLDEPFANLDTLLRRKMRDSLLGLIKKQSITTVLVTHDPDEALSVSDQVVVMDESGRIRQVGTPEQLLSSPADDFVRALVGESFFACRIEAKS